MTTIRRLLFLIICSVVLSVAAGETPNCVYTIYVKTSSMIKAGTDSKISLILGDLSGRSVWVPDLESWGLMEPSHNYYERGNLDIFSGLGPCIGPPLCWLNVTSDGSGVHHGWCCDYVEVTSAGPHKPCSQTIFRVDQWLATDVPPFKLTAVVNGCGKDDARSARRSKGGALVKRNPRLSARE
ncbi:hypothetical protein ACJRO7_006082 [Eucalyptus globulus]|uniref:PLAT domain-containing protein n=1 Tax=Eucalyptus globulus TaxID=34317 RepID=A0ABD3IJV3_EUCGL